MISYFDDGGSVSGDSSGIAALPTISSSAQNAFNTAMANAGTASASQAAVQPFNTAQQGVGGLSNQAMQYSAPYGIGNLPAAQPATAPLASQYLSDINRYYSEGGQFYPYQNWLPGSQYEGYVFGNNQFSNGADTIGVQDPRFESIAQNYLARLMG